MTDTAELEMLLKSGGMAQKLTFTVGNFMYNVQQHKEVIMIQAIHKDQYLTWSLITDQIYKATSRYDEALQIPLDAARLFDILSKHKKRDSTITINFPTEYTSETVDLCLEIKLCHSALSFGALATIYLPSQNITFEQRLQKKLTALDETVQQNQLRLASTCDTKQVDMLVNKFNQLHGRMNVFIIANITICICCILIFGVFLTAR